MIDNFNIMFNEVYSVLNLLGREYIYKLPNNVYEFIKNEMVPNYEFNINMERDVISQISKDALAFISYLNLKYWATLEEQRELIKIYKENDRTAGDGKPGSPSWIQPEPRYRQCA